MAVLVWLVRHGRTAWNADGRLLGWTDEPLDEVGRTQARELRPSLAGRSFAGVWSSDLVRSIETAKLAFSEPEIDARLREIDFGEIEGERWDLTDFRIRESFRDFESFQAPGGESMAELRERVTAFLAGLTDGTHLVFAHGGVIRLVTRLCSADTFPRPGEIIIVDWSARRRVG